VLKDGPQGAIEKIVILKDKQKSEVGKETKEEYGLFL
jgi:hypothetical protein